MLCIDPRRTPVAREADVHLAPRSGTSIALMNGLLAEVIARGWIDERYVADQTLGFDELCAIVEPYTPRRAAEICDVAPARLVEAAELLGTRDEGPPALDGPARLHHSTQATAAACQVNNLRLLRGMIGRPGAGIYQMNGQPST